MKSPTTLAQELLNVGVGGLEELRVHLFEDYEDDEEALDESAMEKLYSEFLAEFDQSQSALTAEYGEPSRIGDGDNEVIPLNGVIRFAIWAIGNSQLFLAFAHEDHGLPVLLMLGTLEA
jgi:hypothetical protein